MTTKTSVFRGMLLAGIGAFLFTGLPVVAQNTPPAPPPVANPKPAKGALSGRPETSGAQALAPVAPPPLPAPADKLPLAKLRAPQGFKVEVYTSGINNARFLRQGEKGTIFVSNWRGNKVWAVVDKGGRRENKQLYSGLDWPNGIAIHDGTLYIAEHHRITKAENIEDNLDNPPTLVEIYNDLPDERPHGWRFLAVGPDNKLYVPVGAPCNICMPPETHAQIRRLNLDGSGMEIVAYGVRNTVGFDFSPITGELWFTDNNRDWMSEDLPNCELNRITQPGKQHFGFPYCHQGTISDPKFGWGYSCDDFTPPAALLGPHAAPLGMRFYTGKMFPKKYHNAIFIARHGSWNKSKKVGGDIVVAFLDGNGNVRKIEPFLTGFLENNNYNGRPVDVMVMKDGSLLVSDDWNGAIWRVTYGM